MRALTLLLIASSAAASPTKVSKIVVYPDRAQVTRTAQIACGPKAMVAFEAIPPSADPGSFRAQTSLGTIEGLRAEERTRREAFNPKVKLLDERIRKLEGEAAVLEDGMARLQRTSGLARQLADVAIHLAGREMNEAVPNVKAWNAAFESALGTWTRDNQARVDLHARLREVRYQLDDHRRERQQIAAAGERREHLAEVMVGCPEGRTATVELVYLVGGASWSPAYEARALETEGSIDLSTYATVRQATGEDWKGAQVTLSTALPRQDATPPEIARLNLRAEERKAEKKILVRRDEVVKHAEASGDAPAQGGDGLRAASQGLSVQLVVPDAADVLGDGTPVRLLVGTTRMKARFALRSAPKMLPFVFRVAELSNAAPYPLLPGPIDVFRRPGYIGRYDLERVAQGERFRLTFGAEESLRVKRFVDAEVKRESGILGTGRRFLFSYRFEIASYLPHPDEVELSEHLPVSELDDVKVALDPATTAGHELRPDDGIITWKVKLRPGEKREYKLAFKVEVPSSYDSGSL